MHNMFSFKFFNNFLVAGIYTNGNRHEKFFFMVTALVKFK